MFHTIIVEDEKPILDLMNYVIGQNPHYTIVGAFTNPLEALARLSELKPDVVFLDVEMPKMNGLELARNINELSEETKIIFSTAYKQYALDAFQVYAFDYILKPVTPAAIERIADRLVKQQRSVLPAEPQERAAAIRCFGGFEVRNREGVPVRFPTRKTEELFALFLCHPGRELSKWHLADLLWPEMKEDRASHNLHNTIYRLKKLLKGHEIGMDIRKINDGYRLDAAGLTYDVLAYEGYGPVLLGVMQDAEQAERLCSLYKGPLLDKKDYVWKASLEEGYARQYTALLRSLVERDIAGQEWTRAERRLDSYLALYPLQEEMNLLLMDMYANRGKLEKLAAHYARFEAAYRREFGTEPPEEIRIRAGVLGRV
ncbi:response regulator [Paenibacillus tyrfis]|uniref:Histidine kinase n=1 Tax=Paenibacillus tyrfis TaxID=1501230 RepID=A0A081P7Q1_9BACL|nr:response regulator [Paenibacillus tyrfis]KEQ26724.1 histidine kinase [Paenibacillus tyrfis]